MAETALAADKRPTFATNPKPLDLEFELAGTVYEGSSLMWVTAGDTHLLAATATAGSEFAGVALEGGVAGERIKVRVWGLQRVSLDDTITNAALGNTVYANGDGAYSVTSVANQQKMGVVANVIKEGAVGTNEVWMWIGGVLTTPPGGVGV